MNPTPPPDFAAAATPASATMRGVVVCGWLLAAWAVGNGLLEPMPVIKALPTAVGNTAEIGSAAWLAAISPASGPAEGPSKGEGESHKSANGKELGDPDKVPTVMIGGLKVVTYKTQTKEAERALLPADLRDNASKDELNRRFHFTPYAHDPSRGPSDAPLTLVAFNDLACNQCAKDVKVADTVYASDTGGVREIEVHLPLSRYSDTNLLAFYGKVAQYGGKYWEYRQKILAEATESDPKVAAGAAATSATTPPAAPAAGVAAPTTGGDKAAAGSDDSTRAFNALVASGVDQSQVRDWLTREARRFYREIDADATLGKALGLDNPPHFYLNGIHMGDAGLPRDRLLAVATWLKQRQHYRLDNEPMARLSPGLNGLEPGAGPSPTQP